jgi:signal transduction histidine kinase
VRRLIDETVSLVKPKADDQGVTIEVSEVGTTGEIRGDPEQLKSCFSNIIINGVQSMEFGGKLNVEIRNEQTGIRVNIRDTGSGIPAEALDHIFEPYYSTKETGVGLGLAVTKRIVEQHRGAINVTSNEGVGTEFSVFLPNTLQTGDLSLARFDSGEPPTKSR